VQAFCDQARALDELDGPPSDEDLERLLDVAPEEIADDAETLVASAKEFAAGNENAAGSDEIQAAGRRLDRYIEDNCPRADRVWLVGRGEPCRESGK
jgi:hypothetical protein